MRKRYIGLVVAVFAAIAVLVSWWQGGSSEFVERDSSRRVSRASIPLPSAKPNTGAPAATLASWFVEPGIASRRVAGVVLANGKPVAGAKVALRSEYARLSGIAPPSRTTDAGGRFDFGMQVPTVYAVSVLSNEHQAHVVVTNLRNPRTVPAPDALVVELEPCASWIYGEVTDISGGTIGNGKVVVATKISMASWFEELYELPLETDGTFSLCRPAQSRHQLWIKAPGYQTSWLREAMPPGGYQVELLPAGLATGVVVDEAGMPIAGARVVAYAGIRIRGAPYALTTLSQDDGSFSFTDLSPGRFEFPADHAKYYSKHAWPAAAVEAGEEAADIRIVMSPLRTIAGVALDGEEPVVGVAVGRSQLAITQEDGSFVASDVGTEFIMQVEGYTVANPVVPAGDQNITDLVVRVRPRAVVRGRITAKGKPVAGATVGVVGETGQLGFPKRSPARAQTGPDGRYQLPGLAKGRYEISARHATSGRRSRAMSIDVGAQGDYVLDIDLSLGANLSGVLVDASGHGVPNVELHVAGGVPSRSDRKVVGHAGGGFEARTNTDGEFEFRGLSSGSYSLCIGTCWNEKSDPRYPPLEGETWPLIDVPNDDSDVEVRLVTKATAGQEIRGVVVDDIGAPHAYAMVQNERRDARARTDEEGRFTLKGLPDGEVTLSARVPNRKRSEKVMVNSGATDVELVVPRMATVSGTIVGGAGPCTIQMAPSASTPISFALYGSDTHKATGVREFHFVDVTPGSHVIEATCESGASRTAHEIAPGGAQSIEVTVAASASLRGTVRSFPSGELLEGFHCSIGGESDESDAQGEFELAVLAAGEANVSCVRLRRSGGAGRAFVALTPGDASTVDIAVFEPDDEDEASWKLLGAKFGPVDPSRHETLVFRAVVEGGAAEQAGIQDGDILVSIAGANAQHGAALAAMTYLLYQQPGARIELVVTRDGEKLSISIELPTP